MKVAYVVGTRPNFVKIAPLIAAAKRSGIDYKLIHTGQHYDNKMSRSFFNDLNIPQPDVNLGVNSAVPKDLKKTTSRMIANYLKKERPDLVVVVGDSDATTAGAMGAKLAGIKLAHVEAGLRSFYMAMPEEANRLYIDKVASYLFVSEPSGIKNLKDMHTSGKVYFVGNVMIDSLVNNLARIKNIVPKFKKNSYAVVTLHRKSNVHELDDLKKSFELINYVSDSYIKLVFPVHPRTKKNIQDNGIEISKNVLVIDPLSYIDFQNLIYNSLFAITDSGGIQDETTFYHKPCITLRYNTERPITYKIGSSVIVGLDKKLVDKNIRKILSGQYKKGRIPRFWDGKASERIARILKEEYEDHNI